MKKNLHENLTKQENLKFGISSAKIILDSPVKMPTRLVHGLAISIVLILLLASNRSYGLTALTMQQQQ